MSVLQSCRNWDCDSSRRLPTLADWSLFAFALGLSRAVCPSGASSSKAQPSLGKIWLPDLRFWSGDWAPVSHLASSERCSWPLRSSCWYRAPSCSAVSSISVLAWSALQVQHFPRLFRNTECQLTPFLLAQLIGHPRDDLRDSLRLRLSARLSASFQSPWFLTCFCPINFYL